MGALRLGRVGIGQPHLPLGRAGFLRLLRPHHGPDLPQHVFQVDTLLLLSLGEPLPGESLALVHDATGRVPVRISENANCRQFTIVHRKGAHGTSWRPNAFCGTDLLLAVTVDRLTLDTFAICA